MEALGCEGLLFDLDGVLIDSSACVTRHWSQWAGRHNIALASVMRIAHGMRTIETMRALAPELDAEAEAAAFARGELADTEGIVALEGAQALLQGLPADRWGIVTSASRELARARLRQAGLGLPSVMVCSDDVQRGKPEPDPYLEGAKRIGWPPERCVAVEDAPAGIESARAAGMQVVGIASTHPRRSLICPLVADRLSELRVEERPGRVPRLVVSILAMDPPESAALRQDEDQGGEWTRQGRRRG
jgi:sugar-phosphatase